MASAVTQSEIRALHVAFSCLAASLKDAGSLDEKKYVDRLESHINGEYPPAESKEIFNICLQNYIEDIKRVGSTD